MSSWSLAILQSPSVSEATKSDVGQCRSWRRCAFSVLWTFRAKQFQNPSGAVVFIFVKNPWKESCTACDETPSSAGGSARMCTAPANLVDASSLVVGGSKKQRRSQSYAFVSMWVECLSTTSRSPGTPIQLCSAVDLAALAKFSRSVPPPGSKSCIARTMAQLSRSRPLELFASSGQRRLLCMQAMHISLYSRSSALVPFMTAAPRFWY